MALKLIVAPIQGHTDVAFRHFHAEVYGHADEYSAPFVHIEHGEPRRRDLRDISSELNRGLTVRPQILFKNIQEFTTLVEAVKAAGYGAVDLNLGCPFVPQVRKGRGAAMITNIDCMKQVADAIAADSDMVYSIKMRLGVGHPSQWEELMPIINGMPLDRLTIHPRIATQQYSGDINMEEFARIAEASKHPVVYNGDIASLDDITHIVDAHPDISGVMIGRGLLRRPSIIAEWVSGEEWSREHRLDRIITFHDCLLEYYSSTLCGDSQILSHIKPFWEYAEDEIGHRSFKLIKKATTLTTYRAAIAKLTDY